MQNSKKRSKVWLIQRFILLFDRFKGGFMAKNFLLALLVLTTLSIHFAPTVSFALEPQIEDFQPAGPRRQMATIIFSGLAGAILGLSTLSFYGRPQDKLSNIAIGFAIGIIAGASYTTYQAATRPYDYLETNLDLLDPKTLKQKDNPAYLTYSWEF